MEQKKDKMFGITFIMFTGGGFAVRMKNMTLILSQSSIRKCIQKEKNSKFYINKQKEHTMEMIK